jgi:hypothetical protein
MRRRDFLYACLAVVATRGHTCLGQDAALFAQSAAAALDHQFGNADLSWLLTSRSGRVLAQRWPHPDQAFAPGSLLKPFIAAAYGEQHGGHYPHLRCAGTQSHCWYPPGHGEIGLEEALAQSCNAYFLGLSDSLDLKLARDTFARLGLHLALQPMHAQDLIGLTPLWRETPVTITHAYLALLDEQSNPSRGRIIAGMEAAARQGTARGASLAFGSQDMLAKTGTASCSHEPRATADGFTLLLYPAADPRMLLLVRQHAATGAQTSTQAGAMLRALGLGTS